MTDYLAVAKGAAMDASRIILDARAPAHVQHKGRIDLVTEVDLASEAAIRRALERATPTIPVFAEEGVVLSMCARDGLLTRWMGRQILCMAFPCMVSVSLLRWMVNWLWV